VVLTDEVVAEVRAMAETLLSNPVIEDFTVSVETSVQDIAQDAADDAAREAGQDTAGAQA